MPRLSPSPRAHVRPGAPWLVATVIFGVAGCHGSAERGESLGLPQGAPASVDPTRLTEREQLANALGLAGETDAALGPRTMTVTVRTEVKAAGVADALSQNCLLEADGRGNFRASVETDRQDGSEILVLGQQAWARTRYGRFVRRRIDAARARTERGRVTAVVRANLEPVWGRLEARETGRESVAGRPALRIALSLRRSGQARALGETDIGRDAPWRKWRDTVEPGHLEGSLLLDAETGTLLAGQVRLGYSFRRPPQPEPVQVEVTLEAATRPGTVTLEPPSDADSEPARPRPLVERQRLLEEL